MLLRWRVRVLYCEISRLQSIRALPKGFLSSQILMLSDLLGYSPKTRGELETLLIKEILSPRASLLTSSEQRHPFHLVDVSPWPLMSSVGALMMVFGGSMYMHGYRGGYITMSLGLFFVLWSMVGWWRDVVRESTLEGQHTGVVQRGIRVGVVLFIVSEVMFFVSFFWAFFHSSLSPSHFVGGVWPPMNLEVLSPWAIPLLNTVILLSSGATVTWAHHSIVFGSKRQAMLSLFFTVLLAGVFTRLQLVEYMESPFNLSDGVYGSTFFLATGFHGFHVFVGTCFLFVCLCRLFRSHFSTDHHLGFEAAAWYWHFVDVVWLFLFISIYWWGGEVK